MAETPLIKTPILAGGDDSDRIDSIATVSQYLSDRYGENTSDVNRNYETVAKDYGLSGNPLTDVKTIRAGQLNIEERQSTTIRRGLKRLAAPEPQGLAANIKSSLDRGFLGQAIGMPAQAFAKGREIWKDPFAGITDAPADNIPNVVIVDDGAGGVKLITPNRMTVGETREFDRIKGELEAQGSPVSVEERAPEDVSAFSSEQIGKWRKEVEARNFVDPAFQESLPGQITEGLGQAAGMIPMAALGLPVALAASFGMAFQAGEDRYRETAERKGFAYDEAEAREAGIKGLPSGFVDAVADRYLLGKILRPLKGQNLPKSKLVRIVFDGLKAGASGGTTEGLQTAYENINAKYLSRFDADAVISDDVINSIIVGAFVDATVSTGGQVTTSGVKKALTRWFDPVDGMSPQDMAAAQSTATPDEIETFAKETYGDETTEEGTPLADLAVDAANGDTAAASKLVEATTVEADQFDVESGATAEEVEAVDATKALERPEDVLKQQESDEKEVAEFETKEEAIGSLQEHFESVFDEDLTINDFRDKFGSFEMELNDMIDQGVSRADVDKYAAATLEASGFDPSDPKHAPSRMQILGRQTSEYQRGVLKVTAELFQGASPFTLIEEVNHGFYDMGIESGDLDVETVRGWKSEVQGGDSTFDDSPKGIKEWIAHETKAWVTGERGNDTSALPEGFRRYINMFLEFAADVMNFVRRGAELRAMDERGDLPAEMKQFMQRSAGLDEDFLMEQHRETEATQVEGNKLSEVIRSVKIPTPEADPSHKENLETLRESFGKKWSQVSSKTGKLDNMVEALNEEGFTQITDITELFDALDEIATGGEVIATTTGEGQQGLARDMPSYSLGSIGAVGFGAAKEEGRTFAGRDGVERFEMDTSQSSFMGLVDLVLDDDGDHVAWEKDLSELMDFPELFENYPAAKDIDVTIWPFDKKRGRELASYSRSSKGIKLFWPKDGQAGGSFASSLLHEVQHWIQQEEGFDMGSSGATILSENSVQDKIRLDVSDKLFKLHEHQGINTAFKAWRVESEKLRELVTKRLADRGNDSIKAEVIEQSKKTQAISAKYDEQFGDVWKEYGELYSIWKTLMSGRVVNESSLDKHDIDTRSGEDRYFENFGEVEARGVQARHGMTVEERKASPFMDSFDSFSMAPLDEGTEAEAQRERTPEEQNLAQALREFRQDMSAEERKKAAAKLKELQIKAVESRKRQRLVKSAERKFEKLFKKKAEELRKKAEERTDLTAAVKEMEELINHPRIPTVVRGRLRGYATLAKKKTPDAKARFVKFMAGRLDAEFAKYRRTENSRALRKFLSKYSTRNKKRLMKLSKNVSTEARNKLVFAAELTRNEEAPAPKGMDAETADVLRETFGGVLSIGSSAEQVADALEAAEVIKDDGRTEMEQFRDDRRDERKRLQSEGVETALRGDEPMTRLDREDAEEQKGIAAKLWQMQGDFMSGLTESAELMMRRLDGARDGFFRGEFFSGENGISRSALRFKRMMSNDGADYMARLQESVFKGMIESKVTTKLVSWGVKMDSGIKFSVEGADAKAQRFSIQQAVTLRLLLQDRSLDATFEARHEINEENRAEVMEQVDHFIGAEGIAYSEVLAGLYAEYGIEVGAMFKALEGHELDLNENYSPLKRAVFGKDDATAGDPFDSMTDTTKGATSKGGALKSRVDTTTEFQFLPADQLHGEHLAFKNRYLAFAPLEQKLRDGFFGRDGKLRGAIEQKHGKDFVKRLYKVFDSILSGRVEGENNKLTSILSFFRSNAVTAVLMVKPKITGTQLGSQIAYADKMPAGQWARYNARFYKNWYSNMQTLLATDFLQDRISNAQNQEILNTMNRQRSLFPNVEQWRQNTISKLMFNVKFGDVGAIVIGGWPVYQYTYDQAIKGGASESKAAHEAEIAFVEASAVQQSLEVHTRGHFYRTSEYARLLLLFTSSPMLYHGQVQSSIREGSEAYVDAKKGKISKAEAVKIAKASAKSILIFHVILPQIYYATAAGFVGMWHDDDEVRDAYWKGAAATLLLGNLGAVPIAGSVAAHAIGSSTFSPSADDIGVGAIFESYGRARSVDWGDVDYTDLMSDDNEKAAKAIASLINITTGYGGKSMYNMVKGAMDAVDDDMTPAEVLQVLGWSKRTFED